MLKIYYLTIIGLLLLLSRPADAQNSLFRDTTNSRSPHTFSKLNKSAIVLDKKINNKTKRFLKKMAKLERKMARRLWKKDSVFAKTIFANSEDIYKSLAQYSGERSPLRTVYSAKIDSVTTALSFLQTQSQKGDSNLKPLLATYRALQNRFNQADQVKKFVAARQKLLKQHLEKLGMVKELKAFQKEAYYFSAQINAYKKLWEDPSALEAKLLELVRRQPDFKSFFANNSLLGSIFIFILRQVA